MEYRTYPVNRSQREPLMRFMIEALHSAGCRVLNHSEPDHAPFRIAFETPSGERLGIIAYAFNANQRQTKNRPLDELASEFELSADEILNLIQAAPRLKMAVRGWVAERHLLEQLKSLPGLAECRPLEGEGQPDLEVRLEGRKAVLIECKNVLRQTYADGSYMLDFQRTRAATRNQCSRYYMPSEFQVAAACLHPQTESWEFRYALTRDLPPHRKCEGRITNRIRINDQWTAEPISVIQAAAT